ncbi:MAG: phage tail protein [Candidatus Accumulibacter sp. UW20]|jgi:phage tail-like protein
MAIVDFNVGVALSSRALGTRLDPYGAFRFLVEIEGITAGGFSDVSGLEITTEVDSIREGGVNDHVHKLPKWTTQSDLVLKKGQTDRDLLWNWYAEVVAGNIDRKNGSIYLLDTQGIPAMWWDFSEAYPIKWSGPLLNAASGQVAFETLTLAHHGLTKSLLSQGLSTVRGAISLAGLR